MLFVLLRPIQADAATKNVYGYSQYKSLVGITVTKHWSTTTFSYDGKRLLDPHSIPRNDSWTLIPTTEIGSFKKWNFYSYSLRGSGQSSATKKFLFGVPTPWGPIGSTITDTHVGEVSYNGFGYVY